MAGATPLFQRRAELPEAMHRSAAPPLHLNEKGYKKERNERREMNHRQGALLYTVCPHPRASTGTCM